MIQGYFHYSTLREKSSERSFGYTIMILHTFLKQNHIYSAVVHLYVIAKDEVLKQSQRSV